MAKKRKMSRNQRVGAAIAAGGMAAGVLAASAASLGTLSTSRLGASANIVAPCNVDSNGARAASSEIEITDWQRSTPNPYQGVISSTQTPSATTGSSVFFRGVILSSYGTTCQGNSFELIIARSTGVSLASTMGNLAAGATTLAIFSPPVDGKLIEQVTLTIFD